VEARYPLDGERDLSIVLCGAAGQGVQTVEVLLARILKGSGRYVHASKEYMSRVRGGSNSTEIRVGPDPIEAPVDRIDLLVPLNRGVRPNVRSRVDGRTTILADPEETGGEFDDLPGRLRGVPWLAAARELGSPVYSGVVAVGLLARLCRVPFEEAERVVAAHFGPRGAEIAEGNRRALRRGYVLAEPLVGEIRVELGSDPALARKGVVSGNDALALGCVAGGCTFVTAYPMSPGTGLLTFAAANARRFGLATEQAEDEIAAVNMALGAWYAGARALVTTSGGGFALMTEGVSLAGITETPLVVHIGQRPGPATGMATRTEQADLNLALHAGHGEFPRAILAPGTIEEAFLCGARAFDLADRFQVPVFLLTDQAFLDSYASTDPFPFESARSEPCWIRTDEAYRRYRLVPGGISPRGVPGFGEGLVCVDSHEHDEYGHMKEDFDLRVAMNDKRLGKGEALAREALPPVRTGPEDARTLVVGWGSTAPTIREALARLRRPDAAALHFPQVWPLPVEAAPLLERAERVVLVEGNATGQFADLLRLRFGIRESGRVLQYSGLRIGADALAERLAPLIG